MQAAFRLHSDSRGIGDPRSPPGRRGAPRGQDDELSFSIELWDAGGLFPKTLVAVAQTPGVAYAAYYAAVREHPDKDVVLKQRGRSLNHWRARTL